MLTHFKAAVLDKILDRRLFHGVFVQLVDARFGYLSGRNHFAEFPSDGGLACFDPAAESLLNIFCHELTVIHVLPVLNQLKAVLVCDSEMRDYRDTISKHDATVSNRRCLPGRFLDDPPRLAPGYPPEFAEGLLVPLFSLVCVHVNEFASPAQKLGIPRWWLSGGYPWLVAPDLQRWARFKAVHQPFIPFVG